MNEDLGLSAIHTILLREHNRVARILTHLNPHWNDETVFQESRRVLGATLQHITYAEFLPVVLGQVPPSPPRSFVSGVFESFFYIEHFGFGAGPDGPIRIGTPEFRLLHRLRHQHQSRSGQQRRFGSPQVRRFAHAR